MRSLKSSNTARGNWWSLASHIMEFLSVLYNGAPIQLEHGTRKRWTGEKLFFGANFEFNNHNWTKNIQKERNLAKKTPKWVILHMGLLVSGLRPMLYWGKIWLIRYISWNVAVEFIDSKSDGFKLWDMSLLFVGFFQFCCLLIENVAVTVVFNILKIWYIDSNLLIVCFKEVWWK